MSKKKPPEEKIGNVAPFGLRMLPHLKTRLEASAEARGVSLNSEIVQRLEETFDGATVLLPAAVRRRIEVAANNNHRDFEHELAFALDTMYPPDMDSDAVIIQGFWDAIVKDMPDHLRAEVAERFKKAVRDNMPDGEYLVRSIEESE